MPQALFRAIFLLEVHVFQDPYRRGPKSTVHLLAVLVQGTGDSVWRLGHVCQLKNNGSCFGFRAVVFTNFPKPSFSGLNNEEMLYRNLYEAGSSTDAIHTAPAMRPPSSHAQAYDEATQHPGPRSSDEVIPYLADSQHKIRKLCGILPDSVQGRSVAYAIVSDKIIVFLGSYLWILRPANCLFYEVSALVHFVSYAPLTSIIIGHG